MKLLAVKILHNSLDCLHEYKRHDARMDHLVTCRCWELCLKSVVSLLLVLLVVVNSIVPFPNRICYIHVSHIYMSYIFVYVIKEMLIYTQGKIQLP